MILSGRVSPVAFVASLNIFLSCFACLFSVDGFRRQPLLLSRDFSTKFSPGASDAVMVAISSTPCQYKHNVSFCTIFLFAHDTNKLKPRAGGWGTGKGQCSVMKRHTCPDVTLFFWEAGRRRPEGVCDWSPRVTSSVTSHSPTDE